MWKAETKTKLKPRKMTRQGVFFKTSGDLRGSYPQNSEERYCVYEGSAIKKNWRTKKILRNELFPSAENWRTRESNRKETIHPYALLEFSIVNILPIHSGKVENVKKTLQKGEIISKGMDDKGENKIKDQS